MESHVAVFVTYPSFVLTLFFNSFLIYLTGYHTKRISVTYRHMIMGFASFGIGLSVLDILVKPMMHSYNGCFLFFSLDGVFTFSKTLTEIVLAVYSSVYSAILSFLSIQYVFRTCLVMKPNWIEHFQGWKCIFWLSYVVTFGFLWGFFTYFYAYPNKFARDYVRQEMHLQFQVDPDDTPLLALLAYEEQDGKKFLKFDSLVCIFGLIGIMTTQYSIMLICGFLLYKKITNELSQSSEMTANSKVQKQFFKALVYQLAAPSLLVHLPGFPLLLGPFFDFKFSFRSQMVVYFFGIYPLLDSLILFFVVSDYRLAMKKIISTRATQVASYFNSGMVVPVTMTPSRVVASTSQKF